MIGLAFSKVRGFVDPFYLYSGWFVWLDCVGFVFEIS